MAARKKEVATGREFYSRALGETERLLLEHARQMEGVDEEVALLRVKLLAALREHPENYELLLKMANSLVRAAGARYRLSGKAEEDLYQSVLGVLRGIGGVLFPEGVGDGGNG